MKKICTILAIAVILGSCNEDSEPTAQEFGSLNLEFDNIQGDVDFQLNDTNYTNESDETYNVSELKYIISNIELTKSDNTVVTIPVNQSYFVINENGSKTAFLDSIPTGTYTNISFGFGVDPTKYPIASGSMNFIPTAEEAGMLWTWSAGYKFLKFEGTYAAPQDTGDPQPFTPFTFHVGSHGANLDNYKEINLAFAKTITTNSTASQTINFDVSKIFDSVHTMSLVNKDDIQVDPENAPLVAENVQTAFSID